MTAARPGVTWQPPTHPPAVDMLHRYTAAPQATPLSTGLQVNSLQMKNNTIIENIMHYFPLLTLRKIHNSEKVKGEKSLWVRDNVALSGHHSTALTFQTAAGYLPWVLSSLVIVTNERRRRFNASRNKMSCSKHLARCRHLVDWRPYSKAVIIQTVV